MEQALPGPLLLAACKAGDLAAARRLLGGPAPQADPNFQDEAGDTPLIVAARNGYPELVQLLLDAGADVTACNHEGDDALLAASEHPDNAAVLARLLERGAPINHRNALGRTALIEAASIGDLPNVLLLLRHRPDVDVASVEEETALTFAVVNEYPRIVQALMEAGANVGRADSKGWTPLTYARQGGNAEIVRLLTEAGTKR